MHYIVYLFFLRLLKQLMAKTTITIIASRITSEPPVAPPMMATGASSSGSTGLSQLVEAENEGICTGQSPAYTCSLLPRTAIDPVPLATQSSRFESTLSSQGVVIRERKRTRS